MARDELITSDCGSYVSGAFEYDASVDPELRPLEPDAPSDVPRDRRDTIRLEPYD